MWGRRHQGWPTPAEIDVSFGDRRQIDTSSASTRRRTGLGGGQQYTVIDVATPRRRSELSGERK